MKVITYDDQVANYLYLASIKVNKPYRVYKSARIFSQPVTREDEIPLRRPYQGQLCPYPYDYAINESICGGRSAYSRAGGAEPICYAPQKAKKELILNSVNCKTRQRMSHAISLMKLNLISRGLRLASDNFLSIHPVVFVVRSLQIVLVLLHLSNF